MFVAHFLIQIDQDMVNNEHFEKTNKRIQTLMIVSLQAFSLFDKHSQASVNQLMFVVVGTDQTDQTDTTNIKIMYGQQNIVEPF